MSTPEYVILVDEEDQMIGVEEKMKAHELALLHRAFSVFVYRKTEKSVEILLQQRERHKYHCGGLWTNACCSHPRVGEEILEAATRRLKEEISLSLPLKQVGAFRYTAAFANGLTEHEFDHVLVGEYEKEQRIVLDRNEAESYRWVELGSLLKELEHSSEKFTPWFKPALQLVLEDLC